MYAYCKNLLGSEQEEVPLEEPINLPEHLCGDGSELNNEFSVDEVVSGIKALKRGKAVCGIFSVDLVQRRWTLNFVIVRVVHMQK